MSEISSDNIISSPTSENEVVTLIKEHSAQARPLVARGGGHFQVYGYQLDSDVLPVSMTQLNRVIDYPSRDMTITVEAGLTFGALQKQLAEEGQRLPIDVPFPERATIGGAIAANVFGSRGYQVGTWRDYLLGFSAVDGSGRLFKAGGRVVKNVAGYDLGKLLIGSHGTLGLLTQATFKVKPIPETSRFLLVTFSDFAKVDLALTSLIQTATIPVATDLLSPAAVSMLNAELPNSLPADSPVLLIAFEGSIREVDWQLAKIQEELSAVCSPLSMSEIDEADTEALWKGLTETFQHQKQTEASPTFSPVLFQANVKPSAIVSFCERAAELGCALQCHTRFGIVRGLLPAAISIRETVSVLRQQAESSTGSLIVIADGLKRGDEPDPFAFDPLLLEYMRKIKKKLDPQQILSPGKLFA
ncbi:putative FAD-linked oxidoreductase [Polystyrenella longa]|uniref:Putative FAD-linked oxidoreductase n=1 Tax=Polystyrenella longa TaxID=2528007 RepID=A0A518CNR4_9PLAN|nr:FAD-binding oxidoreductase [Polystyrenella longa]QDU80859.1 putative FAD-linked oxidoreductase [Polystyrenella longa]